MVTAISLRLDIGSTSSANRLAARTRAVARAIVAAAVVAGAGQAAVAADEETLRGPDVTIIAEEERVIHEFRQGGELRMVRIVPTFGRPYYLVPRDPTRGFGDLERADMLLPSWVIVEF
jgi:hypothetical protein